ncbi:hypothetical protein A6J84_004150 [Streptococcus sp. FDAARGOS_256]|uniref:Uncharacterized protein n=1 Tax=Streptococcus oralis subsp. oralis TaxID=1891914 RepID=A0A1X1HWH1_STROR|nr:hypothetical protein B7719_05825 [Streptococcus oralis subsp. oralis]ORO64600.1 hypothetical protein B7714_06920 [Streptococcus oralis subsp. oralis]ORO65275.1 hypothetical protein B7715_02495 [Streptococcus oralis subsp. oralis]PNK71522.1 hypothetical protein A6J84_004150 [Streptococcus sp. FDAARGOS_256]QCZ57513.1 hypothetical protein FD735_03820 [Streptococcus sp. 1643]
MRATRFSLFLISFGIPINIEITYLSIDGIVLVVTFQFINQKCDGFIVYETASKIKKNLSSKFIYARLVRIKL